MSAARKVAVASRPPRLDWTPVERTERLNTRREACRHNPELAWSSFEAGLFDREVGALWRGELDDEEFRIATGVDPVRAVRYVEQWKSDHEPEATS